MVIRESTTHKKGNLENRIIRLNKILRTRLLRVLTV